MFVVGVVAAHMFRAVVLLRLVVAFAAGRRAPAVVGRVALVPRDRLVRAAVAAGLVLVLRAAWLRHRLGGRCWNSRPK